MKVVINCCWGGFSLSKKAMQRLIELGCQEAITYMSEIDELDTSDSFYPFSTEESRANPLLVQIVEELGVEADGRFAALKVVVIPDDIEWYIHDYDGLESVYEKHRSWN